jgi:hypothetical protein
MTKKILIHHSSFTMNKRESRFRKILVLCWLLLLLSALACLFWCIEWQYNLPTLIPSGYNHPVNLGAGILLHGQLYIKVKKLPVIHFLIPTVPVPTLTKRF